MELWKSLVKDANSHCNLLTKPVVNSPGILSLIFFYALLPWSLSHTCLAFAIPKALGTAKKTDTSVKPDRGRDTGIGFGNQNGLMTLYFQRSNFTQSPTHICTHACINLGANVTEHQEIERGKKWDIFIWSVVVHWVAGSTRLPDHSGLKGCSGGASY